MPNRIAHPAGSPASFGLVGWLEATRISLPLKGVECRFAICGDLLNAEIDQIFHQTSSRAIDCLYTFPLPSEAAVYRCEMHVNGHVIRAHVETLERAREIVQEKHAAGFRTSLVEMDRDNLFTLALGNLQPDDLVVIRFAYIETPSRLADWTSFSIPLCPGVRYIPGAPLLRSPTGTGISDDTDQVPDASRISPPRIERLHPDAAYLSVEGTLEHPLSNVRDITSPTHPILVRDGQSSSTITLADRASVPDSDFIVRWNEIAPPQLKPLGWVVRDEKESFALIRLEAPTEIEADNDFEQDVYFLLDRSGSMHGLKWQKTVLAFREFVKALGPRDRVWLTTFESSFRDFAEEPLSPAVILLDPVVQKLEILGTAGGTELLPALEHVLTKVSLHSGGRHASLVLITDGEIGNEQSIVACLRSHPDLRVHTFGIDLTINEGFLKKIAAPHGGSATMLAPSDDIVGAVARLGSRLRRPVLTNLELAEHWQCPMSRLPNLHAGESLSMPMKGPTGAVNLTISGRVAGRCEKIYEFELAPKALPAIRLLWAKRLIEHLIFTGDRESAIALARQHNLICEGVAFVAWDERHQVAVSAIDAEVYQPSIEPISVFRACAMNHFVDPGESSEIAFFEKPMSPPGQSRISKLTQELWKGSGRAEPSSPSSSILLRCALIMRALLDSPEGQGLRDLLLQWASEDVRKFPERCAKLQELTTTLLAAASDPGGQIAILSQWVETTFNEDGPFVTLVRTQMLKVVTTLANPRAPTPSI